MLIIKKISTHAPRAGSDCSPIRLLFFRAYFNPRSPCGERPGRSARLIWFLAISTHAPRAGSDHRARRHSGPRHYFNPRSPCGERPFPGPFLHFLDIFQPTLPVRGATALVVAVIGVIDFNPRSPCRERLGHPWASALMTRFQPTLPVRGATDWIVKVMNGYEFQPTLPVRGATPRH